MGNLHFVRNYRHEKIQNQALDNFTYLKSNYSYLFSGLAKLRASQGKHSALSSSMGIAIYYSLER